MLRDSVSVLSQAFFANAVGLSMLLSRVSSLGQLVLLLVCSKPSLSETPDASVSMYSGFVSS